jgi:hypothetical protein
MIIKASEKGQALILITLAAVGLFAFAALAIDGSMAFSNKRHAQNAADTAAMAGALSYAREGNTGNVETVALTRAEANGFENISGDTSTVVTVTITDSPIELCPGKAPGKDITVTIESHMNTTFSKILGRSTIESGATATSRACGFKFVPLFDGNAIVSLNDSTDSKNCPFDSGQSNSAHWKVEGGGIFSNGCAHTKDDDAVEFDPGKCVTTVGNVEGGPWDCTPKKGTTITYPAKVDAIMPPDPCDGTAGDIGITPSSGQTTFENGVYCISNMDALDKEDIVLENATLYVTDLNFDLKFAGTGGFYGTPTQRGSFTGSDDYSNYYMVIARNSTPCTKFNSGPQVIEWRGNGSGSFRGTILAPSACLDLRGNGDSDGMHTQIIAYTVSSNGNAGGKDEVYVNYQQDENHEIPISPSISLLE